MNRQITQDREFYYHKEIELHPENLQELATLTLAFAYDCCRDRTAIFEPPFKK